MSSTTTHTVGLLGHGRIGTDLAERARAADDVELAYVYVRSETPALPADLQISTPAALRERPVDLAVEAATPAALAELAAPVLETSDLLVLLGSAFADPDVEADLRALATDAAGEIYLPHAALFGIDGLVDARSALESVAIEATKAPDHLDFEYAGTDVPEIDGPTTIYEGSVRGLCRRFPRNFNSHAAVAMAGLGLDETTSRLVADPEATTARHVITARGEGFELEAVRDSEIEGVTGDYTLVSTWGSIRRVLGADPGVRFV